MVEGDAVGASYTVSLSHEPAETVTVEIGGHVGTALRLSTSTLSFSTQDWNTPQTVEVTAVDDADAVDEEETLTHTASGGEYGGVSAGLAVTVLDDAPETVKVSFEQASYTVDEGATTSIQVILSEDPEREVTVSISSTGLGGATSTDYSVVPGSVTFNAGEVSKSVVFTATQDTDNDDDEMVRLTFGTLPDGVSPGGTTAATVDIIDDDDDQDIVRVTLILTSSTINESGAGNASTLSATLSAASTATTTVTVSVAPSSAATLSGTTLTIPAGQSNGTGSLTITAVDNITYTGDREVTVSGTAVNSAGVTQPENVVLTIAEDDDRPVRVSFEQGSYTVREGSDVTVAVILNTEPGRSVTVRYRHDRAERGYDHRLQRRTVQREHSLLLRR